MRQLIINADDLGADHARNEGIFEAIEAGVVTAASILVNGPAFNDVVLKISSNNYDHVSFGLHLNLTEGEPLCAGHKFITVTDGCFCGKAEGHRRMMKRGDDLFEKEISQEIVAQITRLRDAGVRIDHLDGHQHIHVFPSVIKATVAAGRAFGIPWIRIPEEPLPSGHMNQDNPTLDVEAEVFSLLAANVRKNILAASLQMTDHFRGLYLKGRLSLDYLEGTLRALPPGLTELMVHPGRVPEVKASGPFSSFSLEAREKELDVLKDRRFQLMLEKYHIQITSFSEAYH